MRFVREYGNYKKKNLHYIPEDIRRDICKLIDTIVNRYEKGYITADEALRLIMEAEK